MNRDWHDMIQRSIAGSAADDEEMALHEALKADAELRALYLDYVNLDVALRAAAERAMPAAKVEGKIASLPASSPWRWGAAAAACAALILLVMLPGRRGPSRSPQDVAVTISSVEGAIARLSIEPPSMLPEWGSPTASMLDRPRIPK